MAKLRKHEVDKALEQAAEDAPAEPPAVAFGPGDIPIEVPPGDPLTWNLADWLAGTGIAVDKMQAAIGEAAARHGHAGIPLKVLQRIWLEHTNPAQVEQAILTVLVGLANVVRTGKGPHGHAGAELA